MPESRKRGNKIVARVDRWIGAAELPWALRRRIRVLTLATLIVVAVGFATALHYFRLDQGPFAWAHVAAVAIGLGNLGLLRRTKDPVVGGHLAISIVAVMSWLTIGALGGHTDASVVWLGVLPVAGAIADNVRGTVVWLGVALVSLAAFFGAARLGVEFESVLPPEQRQLDALFNLITGILSIAALSILFATDQKRAEQNLASAVDDLERETAYVELLRQAAVSANQARSLDEALRDCLHRTCTLMEWPLGNVFRVDDGQLVPAGIAYCADPGHFSELIRVASLRTDESPALLSADVLETGKAQLKKHVGPNDPNPRRRAASVLGIRTGVAVPVVAQDRVVAILEFGLFESVGQDDRLLAVLTDVGVQVGRVQERAEFHDRLRQSQKMESVGQLAAGIAHEINNPMAFVSTNLNLLQHEWIALRTRLEKRNVRLEAGVGEIEELLEDSQAGVARTIAIVRDMLDFARGRENRYEQVELNELLEGLLRFVASQAPSGLRFLTEWGALAPVPAVPSQMRQVFLNLFLNAVEAVGGEGHVTVETRQLDDVTQISVADDGPGISEEHLDRLFDPFFTTKPVGQGTGLGLFVSYEIIRNHRGEIRVDTALGRGTTFLVRLPSGSSARSRD